MLLHSVIVSNTWLAQSRRPLLSTFICRYSISAQLEISTPTHHHIDTDSNGFLSWLERKSGTEISSALTMGKSSYGQTLYAAKHIQAGDCILKVPYSSRLTLNYLPSEINSFLGDKVGNVAKLALLLLHEMRLGKSSEWAPYISLLPHPDDLHSTIFWSDQELEMIKSCALYEETLRQKAEIEKDFLAIQSVFCDFTLQEFSYAYGLVTSRAWESPMDVYMIPFMDLFNHDSKSEAYVLSDESNRCSEVIADRDYALGEEVFITYGKFSNATLLLDFGFTVSCNEYDRARVQLSFTNGLYKEKLKLLDSHYTPRVKNVNDFTSLGNSFQIRKVKKGSRKGKGIPQSLRAFCRVVISDSQKELDEFGKEALENDGRIARFPLKDKDREIAAHEYLLMEISRLVEEYKKCMNMNSLLSGGKSVVRKRLAKGLLAGEVLVLESAAEWLKDYCTNSVSLTEELPKRRPESGRRKMGPAKPKQKQPHRSSAGETWREESISGGSLKHVDLHTGSNGWASPPGDFFNLRGPNYFSKKAKIPAGEWLLDPAGVDWLRSNAKLEHLLARPDNRVMNALRRSRSPKTFIVAINLQVPGRDHHSAVFYFSTKPDEPPGSNPLLHRFIDGTDAFRNGRFKIANRIVKGPWIVKAAVGSYSACLLGKALNCRYHRGPNYLEIDVDIGSSTIATAILRLAMGCVTAVTVDMGFLVEAQKEEELPERLFGAVRICQMEMGSATFVDSAPSSSKVLPMSSGGESENEDED